MKETSEKYFFGHMYEIFLGIDNSMIIFLHLDVNDLHKFVSVALHTAAGEGDLANDMLSNLKIIGSGYGPLIFDLNPSKCPSFEDFKSSCIKVWDAMDQAHNLPDLLVIVVTVVLS